MTSDETMHDYRGRISAEDAAANIRSNMQLVDSAMSGEMESFMNPYIATGEAVADFVDRLAEKLRGIADEMRSIGASTMTPHELLACYAREVDKVADSLKFAATLGSDQELRR